MITRRCCRKITLPVGRQLGCCSAIITQVQKMTAHILDVINGACLPPSEV